MNKLWSFILLSAVSLGVNAAQHEKWEQGKEISVDFSTGIERKIEFPEMVRFAAKGRYQQEFTHSMVDNVVFIKPISDFSERLTYQGLDSGRFYIISTSASSNTNAGNENVIIHIGGSAEKSVTAVSTYAPVEVSGGKNSQHVSAVQLVQYAAQTLYAPSLSLVEPVAGIKRVPVKTELLPYLYRGGEFVGKPIVSWASSGMYVTAVKLSNVTSSEVVFDACKVRGDFSSVTAQFSAASKRGTPKDFTVVYLVSLLPFDVAIQGGRLLCV